MSLRSSKPEIIEIGNMWIWKSLDHIQLGIDLAWDLFIFLGTILFAINMYNHPKFGKIFSLTGVIVSSALILINILSFPIPPAEAKSIDLGPILGLWGLAVTVNILLKYKWIEGKLIPG